MVRLRACAKSRKGRLKQIILAYHVKFSPFYLAYALVSALSRSACILTDIASLFSRNLHRIDCTSCLDETSNVGNKGKEVELRSEARNQFHFWSRAIIWQNQYNRARLKGRNCIDSGLVGACLEFFLFLRKNNNLLIIERSAICRTRIHYERNTVITRAKTCRNGSQKCAHRPSLSILTLGIADQHSTLVLIAISANPLYYGCRTIHGDAQKHDYFICHHTINERVRYPTFSLCFHF